MNKEIEPQSPSVDSEEEGLSKEEYEKILKIPSRRAQKAKMKKEAETTKEKTKPIETPSPKEEIEEIKVKKDLEKLEEKPIEAIQEQKAVEEKSKKKSRGRPKKAPEEKKPKAPHPFKKMREINKDYDTMRNELIELKLKLSDTKKADAPKTNENLDEIKLLKKEIEELKKSQIPKKKTPFDKLGDNEKSLLDRLRG